MKTKKDPADVRSDVMVVRVTPAATLILRGIAAFHKQTVSQYVRGALQTHVAGDLELTARAMRIGGWSKRRISREIKKIMRGGV